MSDIASLFDALAPDAAGPAGQRGKTHAAREHDDYSTTEHYIKLVRAALGGTIACDPASSDADNLIIKATLYYTHERSGLAQANHWQSPFFLNPPSVRRDEFVERAAYYAKADYEGIVVLQLKHLCARYAAPFIKYVSAVHIPLGRPAFEHRGEGRSESPTDGRVFLYAGYYPQQFCDAFSQDKGWTFHVTRVEYQRKLGHANIVA